MNMRYLTGKGKPAKHTLLLSLLVLWPTFMTGAFAAESPDNAGLPYWCDEKTRQATGWTSTLQGGIYHYCGGLRHLNNYFKAPPQRRAYALEKALGEFNYMIANNPGSTDPLLGEVYLNKGVAYRLGGNEAAAMSALQQALDLNPKLVQAYTELASIYGKLKQDGKALELVSEGLRHVPDAKSLQRRYTALGGKLPYPAPIQKPVEQAAPPTSVKIEQPPEKLESAPTEASGKKVDTPVAQPEKKAPAENKNNPWCRFCP